MTALEVLRDAPDFVKALIRDVEALGLKVATLPIDHICCRASTEADYTRLCGEFNNWGALLSEAVIGGRPISTFKLHAPISVGHRLIDLIEIPAPKTGQAYATGLEHCEFVIVESFESIKAQAPDLLWNDSGISKSINPELALGLSPGRSVKFHHQSLERVIEFEAAASL